MPDLGLEVLLKGSNMLRLLQGLWVALRISLIAVVISIPLGLLFGVLMTRKNVVLKAIFRVYLEFIRIMPQLVLLFLFYFSTTRTFGWNLSGETASIIVFVLWGTAEMSDLVRGALISIPKHQCESSEALGLTKAQTYWYIIIPQTVRRLIPLSINLITRMIKTTSLVLMIGVVEVLKVAQQIIEANRMASPNAAFGIYLVVFLLYFLACAPAALVSHLKNHLIDRGAVKFCVPFGAMTSLLASFAAAGTDTSLLRRLFGVLLLYIGAKELFTKRKNPGTDPKPSSSNRVTRENHGGSPPRNP